MFEGKYKIVKIKDAPKKVKFWYFDNGIYVHRSAIPINDKQAELVYFVSDKKGNEYGQFPNLNLAKNKAKKLEKNPQSESGFFGGLLRGGL